MLEKIIEKKVCDFAKKVGMLTFKLKSNTQNGLPDRCFVNKNGNVFFVEFKKKINNLQNCKVTL